MHFSSYRDRALSVFISSNVLPLEHFTSKQFLYFMRDVASDSAPSNLCDPRENRLCPSCRSNEIEDETHFLFNCPKYFIQRDELYNKVQFYVHNIKQLPPIEAIKELMNSSNYLVNLQLMKFVLSCFDLRSKLLSI